MQVHLVEDAGNCPGRVYAVFANKADAERFASAVSYVQNTEAVVVTRQVWRGQPPAPGMND